MGRFGLIITKEVTCFARSIMESICFTHNLLIAGARAFSEQHPRLIAELWKIIKLPLGCRNSKPHGGNFFDNRLHKCLKKPK